MIKIRNISGGTIIVSVPELRYRRKLLPGTIATVSQEDYEQMVFDPGFASIVKMGHLIIEGTTSEENTLIKETVETVGTIFEKKDIVAALEKRDAVKVAQIAKTGTVASREILAQAAVDLNVTHNGIVSLIEQYCGVDVITAITRKHEAEKKDSE